MIFLTTIFLYVNIFVFQFDVSIYLQIIIAYIFLIIIFFCFFFFAGKCSGSFEKLLMIFASNFYLWLNGFTQVQRSGRKNDISILLFSLNLQSSERSFTFVIIKGTWNQKLKSSCIPVYLQTAPRVLPQSWLSIHLHCCSHL